MFSHLWLAIAITFFHKTYKADSKCFFAFVHCDDILSHFKSIFELSLIFPKFEGALLNLVQKEKNASTLHGEDLLFV